MAKVLKLIRPEDEESDDEPTDLPDRPIVSLMDEAFEIKKKEEPKDEAVKKIEEETQILQAHLKKKVLRSDKELAEGLQYTEPVKTSWVPPSYISNLAPEEIKRIRETFHVDVEGEDIIPPITHFQVRLFRVY